MKTRVLAPIEVESLFEKRPNFSWVYKATSGSFIKAWKNGILRKA